MIGIIGKGAFGQAIGSLILANGGNLEYVDIGDTFSSECTVVFLTVPVQYMREALQTHVSKFSDDVLIVNCCKGIEKKTAQLPYQIVADVCGETKYASVSGPSFASEMEARVPTTVSIAGSHSSNIATVSKLLTRPYFILETLGTVQELELAGAMKNIYAIASGYVAGSGGGKNTHAHVQVVALREYTALIQALAGSPDVVRPGIVGDLILTCGSEESRNYQYGYMLAQGKEVPSTTAEGVHSAESIQILAEKYCQLPLALAVLKLVSGEGNAHDLLYKALGFTLASHELAD